MRTSWLGFVLLAFASLPVSALAEDEASGRYTMERTDDGIVRLDTKTGAMALCKRDDGRWACEGMDDSQDSLRSEIERLEAENKSLRAQVEDMEQTFGLGDGHGNAPKPDNKFSLPSEQDVDKAFDYLENMLKKLKERMERMEEKHGAEGGDGREL